MLAVQWYRVTIVICSCKVHPAHTLIFYSNLACPHLSGVGARKVSNEPCLCTRPNVPEITASLILPCSSLAMRSASSIRSVPKPFRGSFLATVPVQDNVQVCAYLMLELSWVSSVHRHSGAIYMELPHDTRPAFCPTFSHEFQAKCPLFGAFS